MISLIWIWPIVSLSPTNNVTKVNTDLRNVLTGISLCYPHTHSLPDLVIVIGNVAVLLNFIPNQMFSWKGKFVSKLCNIRWPWAPTELSVLCVLYCNLDLNWSFKHNETVARIKTSRTLCQKAHLWGIWFYVSMSGILAVRWLATSCSQCRHLLRTFTCRSTRKSDVAVSNAKMDKVETPTNWKELFLHTLFSITLFSIILSLLMPPEKLLPVGYLAKSLCTLSVPMRTDLKYNPKDRMRRVT